MLLFQIWIENHGQVADEDSSEPGGADFFAVDDDQAILARNFELGKLASEVTVKIDAELAGNLVFHDDGVAEKAIDDRATQTVVFGKPVAAHGGDAAVR